MSQRDGAERGLRNPRQLCLAIVGAHAAVGAFYAAFVRWAFNYRQLNVALHAILLAFLSSLVVLLTGLLLLIPSVRRMRLSRCLVAAIPSLLFSFLCALYIADYISNDNWGGNLTWTSIRNFIPDLPAFAQALPWAPAWVLGSAALVAAVPLAAYWITVVRILRQICPPLQEGDGADRCGRTTDLRRIVRLLSAVTLAFGLAAALWLVQPAEVRARDPLLGLWTDLPWLTQGVRAAQLDRETATARERYRVARSSAPLNVVLITCDSMRADHLSAYGYERDTTPYLTSLCRSGYARKVEYAVSACNGSRGSIASMLCGRSYGHISSGALTLQEALKLQGYSVYLVLAGDHTLHGEQYWKLLSQYADFCFQGGESLKWAKASPVDDRAVLDGLARIPPAGASPAFFYFHLMSSHFLGTRQPEYQRWMPEDTDVAGQFLSRASDGATLEAVINRYDNGILQADGMIRRILESLEAKHYLPNALVIVTADHGEALGERGHERHGRYLYGEETRIPLFVCDNPGRPYGNLEFASLLDIAPTVVDRMGLPAPACWEGVSLLNPCAERYVYQTALVSPYWHSVLHRTANGRIFKYLAHFGWDERPEDEQLFELLADPQERRNLLDVARPELVQELRSRATDWTGYCTFEPAKD